MRDFTCPTAIIWGYGNTYNLSLNLIKYQEMQNNIKIIGVTGRGIYHQFIDGYPCVHTDDLLALDFDYLIISAKDYYDEIYEMAASFGIEQNKLIDVQVFSIPNFNFFNYVRLVESHISIIANNCWGGGIYHLLRMQFQSPFINMFVKDKDYIKLLKNIRLLCNKKIEFTEWNDSDELKRQFPVYQLDNIRLYFNHYISREEVEFKWYERVERINWNNLFIMMFTEDINVAQQFDELDFERKVCFVPFECGLESAYTLKKPNENMEFWEVVNGIAWNRLIDYNVIDMLCGIGKKHDRLCFSK